MLQSLLSLVVMVNTIGASLETNYKIDSENCWLTRHDNNNQCLRLRDLFETMDNLEVCPSDISEQDLDKVNAASDHYHFEYSETCKGR